MKAKFLRDYMSQNGTKTFVYEITKASDEDLAKYQEIQGKHFRPDDVTGRPLYFTTNFFGDSGTLIITDNDKIVADMSEFDKAKSICEQYGGDFGKELAKAMTAKLMNLGKAEESED